MLNRISKLEFGVFNVSKPADGIKTNTSMPQMQIL